MQFKLMLQIYNIIRFPYQIHISACWGARHTFTLMSFLGIAVNYCMRVNMSVAIVAMAKPGKLIHCYR